MKGIVLTRVHVYLPAPTMKVEGSSRRPARLGWPLVRSSSAEILRLSLRQAAGSKAVAPATAAGVLCAAATRRSTRRRTSLQSPRFSVIAHTSRIVPPLRCSVGCNSRTELFGLGTDFGRNTRRNVRRHSLRAASRRGRVRQARRAGSLRLEAIPSERVLQCRWQPSVGTLPFLGSCPAGRSEKTSETLT